MRRGLAVLIVASLGLLQVQALSFHVHAVPDHSDDRDHHHGPAIHHHEDTDGVPHVDGGDASAFGEVITVAVPVATPCAAVSTAVEAAQVIRAPALKLIGDARAIDVRSHGPPPARNSFLRGPPASSIS